jgi:hypothetical protein
LTNSVMSIVPLEANLTSSIFIPALRNSDMGSMWSIREQDFLVICSL